MSRHVRTVLFVTVTAILAITGCAAAPETDAASAPQPSIVFEGTSYSQQTFNALGVAPVHYVSTVESARDGVVYAFATAAARDAFTDRLPRPELRPAFNRNNSKFYEDPTFDKKLLEVGVGEAVRDLGTHPCNCDQMISSIKASQDARWTKVYDAVNLNPDFGEWWIASGAEISNLAGFSQPTSAGGESWVNDISSIEVTD